MAVIVIVASLTFASAPAVEAASKKAVKVTNLPSNTVTIKQKKTFKLKTNYSASRLKFTSNKPKIAKVSSKGVIKGVKKGKAQITISLKANPSVKKKINVIIGTPVTKVSLSRTSLSLATGKSTTLKATVSAKTASNKKVLWTSSDSKVATVNSAGYVKAIKAGTVTITATAADGSGKKAGCKVTVADPVKVIGAKILNMQTIQVKLSRAQTLSKSDFNLKVRTVINGRYNKALVIESISTTDKINYTIMLKTNSFLSNNEQLRIEVSHLFGTGTQVVGAVYSEGNYKEVSYEHIIRPKDSTINEDTYIYSKDMGYCNITVTGLPEGISYKVSQKSVKEPNSIIIYYSGTASKPGTYTTTIKCVDELGNIYIKYVIWHITSDDSISAYMQPVYEIASKNGVMIGRQIVAYGGSENYSYSIEGEDYGLVVSNSGRLSGRIYTPGVYNVKVLITDTDNPSVTKTVTCTINLASGAVVSGVIKDKRGELITDARIKFVNKDKTSLYPSEIYTYSRDYSGEYTISVIPGIYDIQISMGSCSSWIYGKRITGDTSDFDIITDLLKVKVVIDGADNSVSSFYSWRDDAGEVYGYIDFIYVKPGTYKLTSLSDICKATINATITDVTKSVTAFISIREDIASVGDNSVTNAKSEEIFSFKATKTGTYYIYSSSGSGDPYGLLYGPDGSQITNNDDGGKNIVGSQKYDFCIEYNLEAGKTYFIKVANSSCELHITYTKPQYKE